MGHHVLRFNVVTGNNVSGERDKRRDLRRLEGGECFHAIGLPPATVFQLNADRRVVDTVCTAPEAQSGMPRQLAFRHQLPDARFALWSWGLCGNKIVRTDVFVG